ncbi:MAG TPA: Rieske 2Fe-2S domain-containing protein [Polyangiaceae bacterium]|nr:Rieske 2Fe-2S domain-containing protein [Polyangiaceae bacterium]
MRFVGRVSRGLVEDSGLVRLDDPPFHVLVALVDGVACAIEDACNHAGASLSDGERIGASVVCPMHGYRFDLITGRLLAPLGLCGDQRRLIARVVGDEILVWDPGAEVAIVGGSPGSGRLA